MPEVTKEHNEATSKDTQHPGRYLKSNLPNVKQEYQHSKIPFAKITIIRNWEMAEFNM
jgi:hypothetical protein